MTARNLVTPVPRAGQGCEVYNMDTGGQQQGTPKKAAQNKERNTPVPRAGRDVGWKNQPGCSDVFSATLGGMGGMK